MKRQFNSLVLLAVDSLIEYKKIIVNVTLRVKFKSLKAFNLID